MIPMALIKPRYPKPFFVSIEEPSWCVEERQQRLQLAQTWRAWREGLAKLRAHWPQALLGVGTLGLWVWIVWRCVELASQ